MEETIAAYMYLMWRRAARREMHTDESLQLALSGDLSNNVKALMLKNFMEFSAFKFKFRQFHDMDHASLSIRMFGHSYNMQQYKLWSVNTKKSPKPSWKLTSECDAEVQMAKTIERREVLAYLAVIGPIQASKLATRKTRRHRHLRHNGPGHNPGYCREWKTH